MLPRIDRYARSVPVLETLMLTLYHLHSPGRYPAIFPRVPAGDLDGLAQPQPVGQPHGAPVANKVFILMMVAALLGYG